MDESSVKKQEKPPNPRANANPISKLTYTWTLPLFQLGHKRELQITDLYTPLKDHTSSYLGDKFEREWYRELEKRNNNSIYSPSLLKVMFRVCGWEIAFFGLLLGAIELGFRLVRPMFLGLLIRYFSENQTGADPENQVTIELAYMCAAGLIFCSAVLIMLEHPFTNGVINVGMKLRVGCCSLVYRKVLKLSKTALGETTIGEVVNLLSNDVNRFDYCVMFVHYPWVGPLQTVIVTYFLWQEVGMASIVGVATLLLVIPMQLWLGKKSSQVRLRTAIRTDKRLRLMNEVINGIQVIKMYTWEKPFAKLVSMARRKEVDEILKGTYIRAVLLSFFLFHIRVALFLSVVFYVLQGEAVSAEKVFVVASYYEVLRTTMTLFFPQALGKIAEVLVSIKRIQAFLMFDETLNKLPSKWSKNETLNNFSSKGEMAPMMEPEDKDIVKDAAYIINTGIGISIANATAKWQTNLIENTLSNINLEVPKGQLTVVIGTVGSGKSSLLQAILRELPVTKGSITVGGTISYASQEPWLFAGSVRQNILFGEPYERERYRKVTRVCALVKDFELMPYGDKTIVGDRGVSLSGGQRARINLARAIYKKADIYLLDDPLSAVDTHVGKHLFETCIVDYLRSKTCILVTHQLQYLNNLENIVMLSNGSIVAQGSFKNLQASEKSFAKLLQSALTEKTEEEPILQRKHSSQHSVASSVEDGVWYQQNSPDMDEGRVVGSVGNEVYKAYFKASGTIFMLLLCALVCVGAQVLASSSDYWVTYWVNIEESNAFASNSIADAGLSTEQYTLDNFTSSPANRNLSSNISEIILNEDSGSNNRTNNIFMETLVTIMSKKWYELNREACIFIFSTLTIMTVVVTLLRSFMLFNRCVTASMNLHDCMFNSITRATMQFFNTNSSGRILNRFSKDIGSLDEILPVAIIDCTQIGLSLIGIVGIVAYVNYTLLFPTFLITVLFYYMRRFYLVTSRSIKRLEGVTRSPVFSHLSASLHGLTTIRAFKAQSILEKEFDNHQDLHTSAWYIFNVSNHAFGFWLDVFCVVYISFVTLSFLFMDSSEIMGGNVGLAITQSLALTGMFQWGMRQTAELENLMVSVERVLEYSNIENEPPLESAPDKKPPGTWPKEGKVVFSQVVLQYGRNESPVLKDVTFTAEPGDKIGIVGRTGAGKSSLISALYRLAYIEGEIYIDDIATSQIGLHDLRSKISIIPQEPVLFSGSMRKNLDPFDEFSDNTLWNALAEVELKEAVGDLPGGLNAKMSEGGSNFSVGQRQLVCLARAIVRNNKILVLDEATANVDPQTDALIQETIRKKFADCTMLTIAHRLHTVMDSDKVLVMNAGSVVEFDHPHKLLQNKNGFFYKMVEETGKATTETLHRIAADNYQQFIDED